MTHIIHKYWQLSNAGESHEPSKEGYRCMVEEFSDETPHRMKWEHVSAIWKGDPLRDWDGSLVVKCDEPGSLEDMPWANMDIVSNRLRSLLDSHAPSCAQYLPMTLCTYDGKPALDHYWIANWTHVIECFDDTYTTCITESGPFSDFGRMVIDVRKIPEDVSLCRMRRSTGTVLIRDDVKRAIQAANMTGCQFYPIEHLHEVEAATAVQKAGGRKRKA